MKRNQPKQPKQQTYDVPVVCAWCKEYMRTEKSSTPTGVSHGICPSCDSNMKKQIEERKTACPAN